MQLFLLDGKKITKLVLPNEIDGAYFMEYKPETLPVKKVITIEANGNQWVLKSGGEVTVLQEGITDGNVILHEYNYYPIRIRGCNETIGLFCIPSIENNYYRVVPKTDRIVIGSNPSNGICYQHPFIQDAHAMIYQEDDELWYIDCSVDNLVFLNGHRIFNNQLKTGDIIFIYGLKIIWLKNFLVVFNPQGKVTINGEVLNNYNEEPIDNTAYQPVNEDEASIELYNPTDYFFHTPRMKEQIEEAEVVIDAPPNNQLPEDMPAILMMGSSITMLASAFMSGWSIIYALNDKTKTITALIPTIVMFFAMLLGGFFMPQIMRWYRKRKSKKKEKLRQTKYRAYLDKQEHQIEQIIAEQTRILQKNNPSLTECEKLIFSGARARWSREIKDEDFLTIRLGVSNIPAGINIKTPQEHFSLEEDNLLKMVYAINDKDYSLKNVPLPFSFLKNQVSAIICDEAYEQSYINGLITQLVTFHSAADLKLVFLLNEAEENAWEYARYLPHTLSSNKTVRYFANNLNEIKQICSYLEEEYNERKNAAGNAADETYLNFSPYYLIITNDYLAIKNIPIIDNLISANNNLGYSFLLYEKSMQKIPNKCNVVVQILEPESTILRKDLNQLTRFVVEYEHNIDMRQISSKLANIPVMSADALASLPTTVTFLEMFNVSKIEQLNVGMRWKESNPTLSLRAPIGVHTTGDQFHLDIHEKFHGPHGLIAGTTGSGKSEFLITYLLSLALNYHPDEVQFVLIDYKGGGLAGAFENRQSGMKIPHLVGTITNLDVSEMNRTLVSINSELKRRQKVFNDARNALGEGTIDIYKYQTFYRDGLVKEPMSHLLIVCDEFAELKMQQPDFMDELISAARIGRSLGVHLLLATQKPSGIVTDQIWSNSRFKVCLKVQDAGDSNEMLKRPDAASLKEAGRFYLQVGFNEYFDIGQSGWSGAKYIPTNKVIKKVDDAINFIDNTGYVYKTINDTVKREETTDQADQLTSVVKYIIAAATKDNYVTKQLWRSIIPGEIYLNDLKIKYNYQRAPFYMNPVIGEYDNPTAQLQGLLTLDITNRGNTIIYGTADSGKDNLLSTIIYSTIIDHHPSEVNFYIIDFGAETLRVYEKMPHVGDICLIDDGEKIGELIKIIEKEINRRKQLFIEYNGSYIQYCQNSGKTEPSLIIIINNYESFVETYDKYAESLTPLYRDCIKYGIFFVITATNSVRSRVAELFNNRICLQMPNDTDYRDILGSPRNLVPLKIFGRGIAALDQGQYEFQTAYIHQPAEINNIIKLAVETFSQYNYQAKRIPVVPDRVTEDLIINQMKDLAKVPIGINIETKETLEYNFVKNRINLIGTNDLESNSGFIHAFLNILKKANGINIKVIDTAEILNPKKTTVECFKDNFQQAFATICREVLTDEAAYINNVYVFVGINELRNKLTAEGKEAFKDFFTNANNYKKTNFIFIDTNTSFRKLQTEPWYETLVDKTSGIWLGYGVDDQFTINFANLSMEDRRLRNADFGFVANKSNRSIFKKVTLQEEGVGYEQ